MSKNVRARIVTCVAIMLAGSGKLGAAPIEIPVFTTQSTVDVQFCLGASCDSDSSPVSGFAAIKLDDVLAPTLIELHDFDLNLTETINLALTGLTATGTGVGLSYATPGSPLAPEMLGPGGEFAYTQVPSSQSGIVSYSATGFTCLLLIGAGFPCADTFDLSQQGTQSGAFDGVVTALPGRVVRLILEPFVSGPINPDAPALGTLTISGTIIGETTVPLRGDADLNGVIDGSDIQAFVDVLLDPDGYAWPWRFAVDMNDDDAFDLADAALFIDCLIDGDCGN